MNSSSLIGSILGGGLLCGLIVTGIVAFNKQTDSHNGQTAARTSPSQVTTYSYKPASRQLSAPTATSPKNPSKADKDGWTPLMRAAYSGNYTKVSELLQQGSDIKNICKAFSCAACEGYEKIVELLLKQGASINGAYVNYDDMPSGLVGPPLLLAARNGHAPVVKLLLSHGADVSISDSSDYASGYTPIHEAAENGHAEVIRILLEHGADVNSSADFGTTPLDLAAENGHFSAVELLLNKGANILGGNGDILDDQRPIDLARKNGHDLIVILLKRYGAK